MTSKLPTSSDWIDTTDQWSRVKLVAIDIDGTLLTATQPDITDIIAGRCRSLRSRGVSVMIATGRAWEGTRSVISKLEIPHRTPTIVYNGACIVAADGTGLIRSHSLSVDETKSVVDLVIDVGLSAFVYYPSVSPTGDLAAGRIREDVIAFNGSNTRHEFNGLEVRRSRDQNTSESAVAILLEGQPAALRTAQALLRQLPFVSVTHSSDQYLEVRPAGCNKASALERVANGLGIDRDEILAIGDNNNDSEMLQWSGLGAYVGTMPETLRHERFVRTGRAGPDGVVQILRLLSDAKRELLGRIEQE